MVNKEEKPEHLLRGEQVWELARLLLAIWHPGRQTEGSGLVCGKKGGRETSVTCQRVKLEVSNCLSVFRYLCVRYWSHYWRREVTIPTIMWLQTSQNVGFLKMCSMKQCPAESTCSGLRNWERDVGGGAQGMAGGTGGMGRLVVCGGAIPMLQRWPVLLLTSDSSSVLLSLLFRKKLSALLLRMLLVLKDSERLSLCSCKKKNRGKRCWWRMERGRGKEWNNEGRGWRRRERNSEQTERDGK